MGEKMNVYWLSVGKLEGKRPLERARCSCVNNIKKGLGERGWDIDWIGVAQ
jgi:hypothetical protein